jgi:hypothetical protein
VTFAAQLDAIFPNGRVRQSIIEKVINCLAKILIDYHNVTVNSGSRQAETGCMARASDCTAARPRQ